MPHYQDAFSFSDLLLPNAPIFQTIPAILLVATNGKRITLIEMAADRLKTIYKSAESLECGCLGCCWQTQRIYFARW